jgi:Electron transfer DM13
MGRIGKAAALLVTHAMVGAAGFAGGIYALPILIAPAAPSATEVQAMAEQALFKARFVRELPGSDSLHWGEGEVAVGAQAVSLKGRVSPGPDYKLYLSPEFVQTEAEFERVKPRMRRVGEVKTFENFVVPLPAGVDPAAYTTVVVWCETFSEFITAARYR